MIILLILNALGLVLVVLLGWVPDVETLPWGMDEAMLMATSYYRWASDLLPLLGVLMEFALLFFGYKATIWLLRLFRILK